MNDKNRFWNAGVPILLAVMAVCGIILTMKSFAPPVQVPVDVQSRGLAPRPQVPFGTHYAVTATADHYAVLVDLSDAAGYPHGATGSIILKSLRYDASISSAENWRWYVGVCVGAPTVTDTDIIWITGGDRSRAMFWNEQWMQPEHGMNLLVASDETLEFIQSNELATTAAITSTQLLPSPHASLSGTVGLGDLILFLDEIAGTATMTFTVDTSYETE